MCYAMLCYTMLCYTAMLCYEDQQCDERGQGCPHALSISFGSENGRLDDIKLYKLIYTYKIN
jgi:hypothetical protein